MYCSHCGKKVGEDMLFCPFCGKPIVIPEQDDEPVAAPVDAARVCKGEGRTDSDAGHREVEAFAAESAAENAEDKPISVSAESDVPEAEKSAGPLADAAAELLDWDQARKRHIAADVWARPEAPAENFSPLATDKTDEKLEDSDWKEAIIKKKESVPLEKKPPEMKRDEETPVRLDGAAPKLELDIQGAKPRDNGKQRRKQANTLVPPKTMDPDDIFMDRKRAPYEKDDPFDDDAEGDEFRGSFSFEEDDEGSFFIRHLRGIVGLALFAIMLLMFVIYAFSRAGQVSLARVNAAWSQDAYSTLGYQYYQAGDYSQAGLYYERALQREPNSYSFASSAAMAYMEAGENEKAAAMLKRCAEIDPTKLEPYVYLLKLYPDAAARPWDITQLLQQGYQKTGDARLNVTG